MSNAVFVDSSFWIAYRNTREPKHLEAGRLVNQLREQRARYVVTLPVLCEIHAMFSKTGAWKLRTLDELSNNPLVSVEDTTPADREAAIQLLRSNPDKSYSLCDALSFIVMRRLGIRRAAAFDKHFHQIGEFEIIC